MVSDCTAITHSVEVNIHESKPIWWLLQSKLCEAELSPNFSSAYLSLNYPHLRVFPITSSTWGVIIFTLAKLIVLFNLEPFVYQWIKTLHITTFITLSFAHFSTGMLMLMGGKVEVAITLWNFFTWRRADGKEVCWAWEQEDLSEMWI